MGCDHNCAGCRGCAGVLELTEQEIALLQVLGQYAFLPIARKADDMTPMYLDSNDQTPEFYSLLLQVLEQKGLLTLDYDKPMKGGYGEQYAPYPVKGTAALTQKGQTVLQMLDIQGITQ